jgi:ankyrin repeat protein
MRSIESLYREIENVPDFVAHKITSVHYQNGYGDTPLHIVSYWGDCEAISILLDAGADINAVGETGFTPLHCAAQMNKPDAIALLIKKGALSIGDESGETPLDIAVSSGSIDVVNLISGST